MNHIHTDKTDELEVELASGWERIGAVLINTIFTFLAMLPMSGVLIMSIVRQASQQTVSNNLSEEAIVKGLISEFSSTGFLISVLILLGYCIWQVVLMSRTGQSLGKKLLRLKVVKNNGEEAGFVGVVLLREVVYSIVSSIAVMIISLLLMAIVGELSANEISEFLGNLPTLICLIMLFTASDRRTLQDRIADTVVIKLPPQHKS